VKRVLAAVLVCGLALIAAGTSLSRPTDGVVRCNRDLPRDTSPLVSRDGGTLVWTRGLFSGRQQVFAAAIDGEGATPVAVPGRGVDSPAALAPDGSQVLIEREREGSASTLIVASTRSSRASFVTADEATALRREWRAPEWSPDGLSRVESRIDGVWVIPPQGEAARRIVRMSLSHEATWSPDGSLIAFASAEQTGNDPDLYVVRPDGSGLRALTRSGHGAWHPAWSPDSSRIAFTKDYTSYHLGTGIEVIGLNGSRARVVRPALGGPDERSADGAVWAGENTLVIVSWQRREGPLKVVDLHAIGVDGRGERRLTYQCHLGSGGSEIFRGSDLGDTIRTFGGNDEVRPGAGDDDVDAGPGADLVRSADRTRDVVRCGRGRDRVIADRRDRIAPDCERVVRR
jgi:WD40-like Beta Propeller Repeat